MTIQQASVEKLDKILNTAKHLQKHTGKMFITVLLTNKDAPNSFKQATLEYSKRGIARPY